MRKALIDRWADTTAFRALLFVSALAALGGALGFVGWRAHPVMKNHKRRDLSVTLMLLAVGVVTALSVAGAVVLELVDGWLAWGSDFGLVLGAVFAAANLVWAMSGVAWMQRLTRGYAEREGRAFDGLPVLFLLVALALATAAVLGTVAV